MGVLMAGSFIVVPRGGSAAKGAGFAELPVIFGGELVAGLGVPGRKLQRLLGWDASL